MADTLATGTRAMLGSGHDWLGVVDQVFAADLFSAKKLRRHNP